MTKLSAEKTFKLFSASNQMLEVSLTEIEKRHQIDLKRGLLRSGDQDNIYYPQFSQEVRNEAARMAKHYEIFYCLEITIRKVISDALESAEPNTWWNAKRIPQNIFQEVGKRMQRERDSGVTMRSEEPLDFATFGELGEIIKQNWDVYVDVERLLIEFDDEETAQHFERALMDDVACVIIDEDTSLDAAPEDLRNEFLLCAAAENKNRLEEILDELWEDYGIKPYNTEPRETSGIKRIAVMHDDGVSAYGFEGMESELREWMRSHGFPDNDWNLNIA